MNAGSGGAHRLGFLLAPGHYHRASRFLLYPGASMLGFVSILRTSYIARVGSTIRSVRSTRSTLHPPPSRIPEREVKGATMSTATTNQGQRRYPQSQPTYLDQKTAQHVDEILMSPTHYAYKLEQLMELAGLAVAQSIQDHYGNGNTSNKRRAVVCCGPGNNGGDGLVAARHLKLFGFDVRVVYPKQGTNPFYADLVRQLEGFGVGIDRRLTVAGEGEEWIPRDTEIIVDAVFGFSFSGKDGVRQPYASLIQAMNKAAKEYQADVCCVDMPSGWDVELGPDPSCTTVKVECPNIVISLTAPKMGVKHFDGVHYVGGRFMPEKLANELGISLVEYKGCEQFVRI